MEKAKLKKQEAYIKKCLGDKYSAGDEFTISSTAYAIVKYAKMLDEIEQEGDLVTGINKSTYRNPKYEILKYWKAEKETGLKELGLTPKARRHLSGTAEGDGSNLISETRTGRRKTKEQLARERQDALEEQFC